MFPPWEPIIIIIITFFPSYVSVFQMLYNQVYRFASSMTNT